MAKPKPGATAKMLQEIQEIIASTQDLIATLEDVGADTDDLCETLADTVEKNLLESYGAPTLARYIVQNALYR